MLAEAVDIRRWLREDRRTPYGERLARDRAIGRELSARRDLARVLDWWHQLDAGVRNQGPGHRVEAGRRLAGAGLAVFGLLLGSSIAGVALNYDGRWPVNLFTLLGVLVGLPLVMLAFTLLALPGRVPGLKAVQSVAAGMSPARWVGAWLDRFLDADVFAPGLLGGGGSAFSRWQLVVFSQWLALGFFAGAIGLTLLLVTFTDLAFGWSTTLDLPSELVHGVVAALAAPWASWLPQAAPDAALVEASRYFRLEEGRMPAERIARLGAWWPFVVMTMAVYGALPRLLLLIVGAWRLRRATARLLLEDPEVVALLDRLDAPLVGLGSDSEESPRQTGDETVPPPREAVTAEGLVLLVWNAAASPATARRWLVAHLGVEPESVAEVGILQTGDEQRAALRAARDGLNHPVQRVVLVTKGWEPPLLELMDFLEVIREELGHDCSLTVVPLDVAGTAVRPDDREVWARALARLHDPRLYVMDPVGAPP